MLYVRQVNVQPSTIAKIVAVVLCVVIAVVSAYLGGKWLWWRLANYIQPGSVAQRKELVNVFVLIVGGVVAFLTATAAMLNVYTSRRNLHQQRELDERRAQDDTLQAYYAQMGELLAKYELPERKVDDPLRFLARAQTVSVMRRVDARRKGDLVRFLSWFAFCLGHS